MTQTWHSQEADLLYAMADGLERIAQTRDLQEPSSVWQQLAESCQRGVMRLELGEGTRALDTASSAGALLAVSQPQMPAVQQRRLFLRDVVPVVPTSTLMTPFVRELAPQSTELAASGVAEGNTKPDVAAAFNFQGISVDVGTLAANITTTYQLWKDSPAFVAYVSNQRLPYLLRLREEYACFRGDAEVANGGITGILNDSAITADTPVAGNLVQTVANLCAQVAGNGAIPDYAFVNAVDYYNTLGEAYGASGGAGFAVQVLDHLPEILPTLSLAQGTVVAGAFGQGAAIIDREQTAVEVYDQHSDYRTRNLDLVQAEERVGWVVTLPWAFAYATGGSF